MYMAIVILRTKTSTWKQRLSLVHKKYKLVSVGSLFP